MPTLSPSALKNQLAAGRLAPVHLFLGEDVKLIDRMIDAVEATIDPADRPFAVERVYAGETGTTPADIVAAARIFPMLGDRRVVFVLRAERLLKPKRAAKATVASEDDDDGERGEEPADTAAIEEYLADPAPTTSLIFVATEVDRSRRLTKRLMDAALVTEFAGLGAANAAGLRDARGAAAEWLQAELVRSGRSIDPDALRELVVRSGNDITKLRGDADRLLLFVGERTRITADDVMEVASVSTAVDDEWAVVNAIAAGNPSGALAATAKRLDRGDSVHGLVGQLRWWVSAKLAADDPGRVPAALDALLRTDLALKSSGGDERVLVERLVVELTGPPLASSRSGWSGGR